MRHRKHSERQLELDFSAPRALPFEQAVERASALASRQKEMGERWWRWVQQTLEGDPDRVAILCALSCCRR